MIMNEYKEFRHKIVTALKTADCPLQSPQPLAHPGLSTSFTMSLAVTMLPPRGVQPGDPDMKDYGVIQPCLREYDGEQVLLDTVPWHLTFFEMVGAIVDGENPRLRALQVLRHLCDTVFSLDWTGLRFQLFGGGGPFGQDADRATQSCLLACGVPPSSISFSEANYFGERDEERVAGPLVEVGWRGPQGEPRELATMVFLDFSIQPDRKLLPLRLPIAEVGIGMERALCAASRSRSLMDVEPVAAVADCFAALPASIQLHLVDRLRAAVFAIAEGIEPGRKGRAAVLRRILRDFFSKFSGDSLPAETSCAVNIIVDLYQEFYPRLSSAKSITVVGQEWLHEKDRRMGKKL